MKKTDYEKIIILVIKCLNKGTVSKGKVLSLINSLETEGKFIKKEKNDE